MTFFLLHRGRFGTSRWDISAEWGENILARNMRLQEREWWPCRSGLKAPHPASRRTQTTESHGCKIMKEDDLQSFLGMSFFHALPKNDVSDETLHFHRKRYFHVIIHTQPQMKPLLTRTLIQNYNRGSRAVLCSFRIHYYSLKCPFSSFLQYTSPPGNCVATRLVVCRCRLVCRATWCKTSQNAANPMTPQLQNNPCKAVIMGGNCW